MFLCSSKVERSPDKTETQDRYLSEEPLNKCMIQNCEKHGETDHAPRFRLGQPCGYRCRACAVESVDRRRKRIKAKAVDFLGGACKGCGYTKCIAALEFHHRDPREKDFKISASLSWEVIERELSKCDLLCANCHREEHFRLDMGCKL